MYDNICKYLAETYPQDMARWLLGEPLPLVQLEPKELALEPIRADSLILLQSSNLILHLEFQTRPDPEIPFRMLDYWTRAQRKFPTRQIKQIVIYLTPSESSLVYQNYYQATKTRHEFELIRLWETEPRTLLQNAGTIPFAVLAEAIDKKKVLQEVANRIESLSNQQARRDIAAASYVLAGLTMSDNIIKQILRSEMMRESVTFQAILQEGRQVGIQEGRQVGIQEGRQEGLQTGQIQGKREMLQRLLTRKFGTLPPQISIQVECLTMPQLEDLAEAILDMQSLTDLEQWCAGLG